MNNRRGYPGLLRLLIGAGISVCVSLHAWAFDAQKAPFAVTLNERPIDSAITFQPVMPAEALVFRFTDQQSYTLIEGNVAFTAQAQRIHWQAPALPGHHTLRLQHTASQAQIVVQVFVLVPATQVVNGVLNGYKIGVYPPALRGLNSYRAPEGYMEVAADMLDMQISPHFRLGQFLCKQESGFPKYVVLRPRLLQKLELLLQDLNGQGIATDELAIMSGYRTPYYNRAIGNVSASRHLYGGAADVYVDVAPKDGQMDDLNGDGYVNVQDAMYLYERADRMVRHTGRADLTGGVGRYRSTATHGPFVHVDVRGTRARWGLE